MAFVTPAEVETLTGRTPTADTITLAETVMDIHAGRAQEVWPYLSDADQRTLRYAIAFQAVWLDAHPEAVSSMDVESASQLDQSVTPTDADALTLAPLARRVLRRLSWRRRSGSITLTTAFQRDVVTEDDEEWSPL